MSINYDNENKIFNLCTPGTSYIFGIFKDKFPVHIYYGKRTNGKFAFDDVRCYCEPRTFSSKSSVDGIGDYSENDMAFEFPTYGNADLRIPAFHARYEDGSTVTRFIYAGYKIIKGKPKLNGLPAAYVEDDSEADTLEIELKDEMTGLSAFLMYTVYNTCDIITRSVRLENNGKTNIKLDRVMSMNIDFMRSDFDFVHLSGSWARERHIVKNPVMSGFQGIDSKRGASSHAHNPFFALAGKNADEYSGEAYGFGLVYSGNFTAGVEVNPEDISRAFMGINDFNFEWNLGAGEIFQAPEVIMTYSECGFTKMSQTFHRLVRTRICRGKFRDGYRPVLINNWEATYYDFNEEKILNIAKTAKELGVELMVLDDGWFGKRDKENCSLGDWYPYKNKLPDGITGLANKINDMGMQFGLWFEPEMVSPDSDLYRAHPDWIIAFPSRPSSIGRNQYILDLSRKDVREYIIGFISEILSSASISYVKWDMNRNMTEAGSAMLDSGRQQEVSHRYMLGLYEVFEKLTSDFPDVLFEGCSGGGGRFDLGMLYYYPQIWTSDNTDAVERMYIQYGTSLMYPTSSMGAHVSAVPNHQVGRTTSIDVRGDVAMMGRFGFELDLGKLSDEEKEKVKKQIVKYKELSGIIHTADMYRLISPFDTNNMAVEFVSEDKETVIVFYFNILGKPNSKPESLCLKGLESGAEYKNEETGRVFAGDVLCNIGIQFETMGDFDSKVMIFKKIK